MKKLVLKRVLPTTSPQEGYRIAYHDELNPSQLQAVFHTEGPALVLAGAGTGKTRTLTYRVARLVEDGVDPASILLLTFTRKAARQMVQRAGALLDGRCDQVAGGTFHAFAYMLLQRTAPADRPAVSILDQADAEDVMNLVRGTIDVKSLQRRFPKKQTLVAMCSRAVNTMTPVSDVIAEEYAQYVDLTDPITDVIQRYHRYKRQHGLYDYDDLLLHLLATTQDPAHGPALRARFRHIMVDEYQDTNVLQHQIILGLAGPNGNVLAVGDDAQSIYSFRGADVRNIHAFPQSFEQCRVIRLEQNYRSSQPILDVCNTILRDAPNMFEKELFSDRTDGEQPMIVACTNERQQSAFLVQQILELREQGRGLTDIAVLVRSGFLSFDVEIELNKAQIPFRKVGGMRFTEAAHVKDLLALLRITVNPRDVIAWYRLLLLQPGVGPKTAQALVDALSEMSDPLHGSSLEDLPGGRKITVLVSLLRSACTAGSCPDRMQVLAEGYRSTLERVYDDHAKRWKDLQTMVGIGANYATTEEFLSDIALDPPSETLDDLGPDDGEDEFVTLSTIHSAKGLEWGTVFVIWVNEGRLPSSRSAESEASLEEERRLLYVACTRAKDVLVLTYPSIMMEWEQSDVLGKPSRFLDSVAENICPRYMLTE